MQSALLDHDGLDEPASDVEQCGVPHYSTYVQHSITWSSRGAPASSKASCVRGHNISRESPRGQPPWRQVHRAEEQCAGGPVRRLKLWVDDLASIPEARVTRQGREVLAVGQRRTTYQRAPMAPGKSPTQTGIPTETVS